MARLEYFLVAESVSIDQATNQVSVFNVWEEITAPSFPIVVPHGAAITLWNAEDGEMGRDFQAVLRVTLPNGDSHELAANFVMHAARHRVTQRFSGLLLDRAGTLLFSVSLNGRHHASHTVTIRQADPLDASSFAAD